METPPFFKHSMMVMMVKKQEHLLDFTLKVTWLENLDSADQLKAA